MITTETAAERVAAWQADAARIGRDEDHSREVVLSLFDASGHWSQPYADAGYRVIRMDWARGHDLMGHFPAQLITELRESGCRFKAVLSAMPCTSFSASGARWWSTQHDTASYEMVEAKYGSFAAEYHDTALDAATTLVRLSEFAVELAEPELHAFENPIGRMRKVCGLPAPRLTFDPSDYGDPYTKRTQIFGDFNANLPTAQVEPTDTRIHMASGWNKDKQRAERSTTPLGFAYAFFMANH